MRGPADLHRESGRELPSPRQHQQPARIGMAVEDVPNRRDFRSSQLAAGQIPLTVATYVRVLQPHPGAAQPVLDRHEHVDDLKSRLPRPDVDGGQLGEEGSEAQRREARVT